jgi:hypothetical protein
MRTITALLVVNSAFLSRFLRVHRLNFLAARFNLKRAVKADRIKVNQHGADAHKRKGF